MKNKVLVLASAVISSLLLTGCVESYEYSTVDAIVIEKEHDPAHSYVKTTTNSEGNKVHKRIYEDEEFEVVLRYEDIEREFEFEDDDFYDSVKIGQKVQVELSTGLDKEGKVVTRNFDLTDVTHK